MRTPVFEGPLDLLLHLITAQQVDLFEVSIATIVNAYLEEVAALESLDLEVATEFVLVAATLVQLKCRRLLPKPEEVDLDEEIALYEERDLLLARMLECQTFKEASGAIRHLIEDASRSAPRTAGPEERYARLGPDLLDGVSPELVRDLAASALTPRPVARVDLAHLSPVTLTVLDMAQSIASRLSEAQRATFRQLTLGAPRIEVVVSFLALLELYKQGFVELAQARTFGELEVSWTGREEAALAAVDE